MNPLNRRFFLKGAGFAGLTLLAAGPAANRSVADPDPAPSAPASGAPAEADIYPFSLGGTEAFIINDGLIIFKALQPAFAPEAKPEQVKELLLREYLEPDRFPISLNVLVIKIKSGVMLFDTGAGGAFGAIAGRLMSGLAKIGISPADVKTIFITHAHADHIGGLVDANNKPAFPAAKIVIAKTEVDFWMADKPDISGMRIPAETREQFVTGIKKILNAVRPQLELVKPGKLAPEVELLPTHGHTPGHAAFLLTFGGEKLLILGDAVHIYPLQFPHPEWTMMYDTDPQEAIRTRKKLFKSAAEERTLLHAFHLPFPGIGHTRAVGSGYEWVPRAWIV